MSRGARVFISGWVYRGGAGGGTSAKVLVEVSESGAEVLR